MLIFIYLKEQWERTFRENHVPQYSPIPCPVNPSGNTCDVYDDNINIQL